jgi:hypothetical protein
MAREELRGLAMPEDMEDEGMEMEMEMEDAEGVDLSFATDEELRKELEARGFVISEGEASEELEVEPA